MWEKSKKQPCSLCALQLANERVSAFLHLFLIGSSIGCSMIVSKTPLIAISSCLDEIGWLERYLPQNEPIRCNQAEYCSLQALFGRHLSHVKCGHDLDCHTWLESSGCLLTPPGGITRFDDHFPIKMPRILGLIQNQEPALFIKTGRISYFYIT